VRRLLLLLVFASSAACAQNTTLEQVWSVPDVVNASSILLSGEKLYAIGAFEGSILLWRISLDGEVEFTATLPPFDEDTYFLENVNALKLAEHKDRILLYTASRAETRSRVDHLLYARLVNQSNPRNPVPLWSYTLSGESRGLSVGGRAGAGKQPDVYSVGGDFTLEAVNGAGGIKSQTVFDSGVWSVAAGNLDDDEASEAAVGGFNVVYGVDDAEVAWSLPVFGKADSVAVYGGRAFALAGDKVAVISGDGLIEAEFQAADNSRVMTSGSLEGDDAAEIVVGGRDGVSIYGAQGSLIASSGKAKKISFVSLLDLDGDNILEVVCGGEGLSAFRVNSTYATRNRAAYYLELAVNYNRVGEYTKANQTIGYAHSLYKTVGDVEGIKQSFNLAGKFAADLLEHEKRVRANSHLEAAKQSKREGELAAALENAAVARQLFFELNESARVEELTLLLELYGALSEAERYYLSADKAYRLGDYLACEANASQARRIYAILNNGAGVRKAEFLGASAYEKAEELGLHVTTTTVKPSVWDKAEVRNTAYALVVVVLLAAAWLGQRRTEEQKLWSMTRDVE